MNVAPDVTSVEAKDDFVGKLQRRLLRQFMLQATDWQETCRDLPAWEDQNLINSPSDAHLAIHARMLDELERVGQLLSEITRHAEFRDTQTSRQIELTLQDLSDSRAMWHGNISPDYRRELLSSCFNES